MGTQVMDVEVGTWVMDVDMATRVPFRSLILVESPRRSTCTTDC